MSGVSEPRPGAERGQGLKIALMVSRFNSSITEKLLQGARSTLLESGVAPEDCPVFSVPGALELPLLALKLAHSGRFDALVALGAVIQGETAHFEAVCRESQAGLMRVSLETGIPIGFGILTTYNETQARERVGGGHGHKGVDAACSALEMANLFKELP